MGSLTSRQEGTTEELDPDHVHSYKYPPKSGNYFGTHFIMGGEKFETPQPEAYLFGENSDLNFLSSKPAPCPYALSAPNEPSKTLKSLVNIRKDSLRLVRCGSEGGAGDPATNPGRFNIEFTFDSDVRCAVTIHYLCTEDITRNGLVYRPRDPSLSSETYHFKPGAAQTFCQSSHVLEPARFPESQLTFSAESELYPVVVMCQAEEGDEPRQCHVTTGYVDRLPDGSYLLKPLKQKQYIDGLVFLLQEIYGIENKLVDKSSDEEAEDSGAECVICMCDLRDTLILPCRHLCVCSGCADHLRYQANNCPICRAPFRALLQLRAVQRSLPGAPPPQLAEGADCIPAGYEPVALVEALNGPVSAPRDSSSPLTSRAASGQHRNRSSLRRGPSAASERSISRDSLPAVTSASVPPEVRRRVLEERGRAELESQTDATGSVHRSRTPSREKDKQTSDEQAECERRSLLESPPPSAPVPEEPVRSPVPDRPVRSPSDASSAAGHSRLVTVIPIEHQSQTWAQTSGDFDEPKMEDARDLELEDYQDTEDEIIEAQCRPDQEVPSSPPATAASAASGHRNKYKPSGRQLASSSSSSSSARPHPAEVRVLSSESPASGSSRGSLSSSGSTRLLISGASRETEM